MTIGCFQLSDFSSQNRLSPAGVVASAATQLPDPESEVRDP